MTSFTSVWGILSGTSLIRGSGSVTNSLISPTMISGVSLLTGQFVRTLDFSFAKARVDLTTSISPSIVTGLVAGYDTQPYTLTYLNSGNDTDPNATVVITLPPQTYLVSTQTGYYDVTTRTITLTGLSLIPGWSGTVQFVLWVLTGVASGTVLDISATITWLITDVNLLNNPSSASLSTKAPTADLWTTKVADLSVAIVQLDTIRYELQVCNNGPHTASGVVLQDRMPNSLIYQTSTPPYTRNLLSGTDMIYEYEFTQSLPNGSCTGVVISATMGSGVTSGDVVINSVNVASDTIDPNLLNNTDTASTIALSVLTGIISYVFYDTNYNGIRDTGEQLLQIPISISGATAITSGNGNYPVTTRPLVLSAIDPYFQSHPDALEGNYTTYLDIQHPNYLALTWPLIITTSQFANGWLTGMYSVQTGTVTGAVIGIYQPVDLTTTIQVDNSRLVAGYEYAHFTVQYGNNGNGYEPNGSLSITLPQDLLFVSADIPVASFVQSWNFMIYTFALGALPAMTGWMFTFTWFVGTGTLTGTQWIIPTIITWQALDTNITNNTDAATITIDSPTASLSANKTGDLSVAIIQLDKVSYTISACNAGPHSASGVILTDSMPVELALISSQYANWSSIMPIASITTLSWVDYTFQFDGLLLPGTCTDPIVMITSIVSGATIDQEMITNTVSVSSSIHDDDLSNNTAIKNITALDIRDIPSYIFWDKDRDGMYNNNDEYLPISMFIKWLQSSTWADGNFWTPTTRQQTLNLFSIAKWLLYNDYEMWIDKDDADYKNFWRHYVTTSWASNGNLSGTFTVNASLMTGLYIWLYRPNVDLSVFASVSTGVVKSWDALRYTLEYINTGADADTWVTITMPRNPALEIVSINVPYTISGNDLILSIGKLDPMMTGLVTIDTIVWPSVRGGDTLLLFPKILGDGYETDFSYNQDLVSVLVRDRSIDLSLKKTTTTTQLYPDESVWYMFEYANSGTDTAFGIAVSDLLPQSALVLTASVAFTMTGMSWSNLYIFELGDLPRYATGAFLVQIRYANDSMWMIINTGIIAAKDTYQKEENLLNNISVSTGLTMIAKTNTSLWWGWGWGWFSSIFSPTTQNNTNTPQNTNTLKESIQSSEKISPILWEESKKTAEQNSVKLNKFKKFLLEKPSYIIEQHIKTIDNPLKNWQKETQLKLPSVLPQTWTPLDWLLEKWVWVSYNPKVETEMYDWIYPSSIKGYQKNTSLDYWLNRLPTTWWYEQDRNADYYIVIPRLWIVTPIVTVSKESSDYTAALKGKTIDVNSWLQQGVMNYPGTVFPGEVGNAVVVWHSSYFKADSWRYKTIFTSLPLMNEGDEIWVYKKTSSLWSWKMDVIRASAIKDSQYWYDRLLYKVHKSFETEKTNVSIMNNGLWSLLTLVTCTPIGTAKNRWVVQAQIQAPGSLTYEEKVRVYAISDYIESLAKEKKEQLSELSVEEEIAKEKEKIVKFINRRRKNTIERSRIRGYFATQLDIVL
jgi:uncharacterized repeat protein (TIGR01451 family)